MILRACLVCLVLAGPAAAQDSSVSLSGLQQDTSLPVEVTSESLSVDQAGGVATFTGEVIVSQGEMRLAAPEMVVNYAETESGGRRITTVEARGGVTLSTGAEAAEAQEAVYTLDAGRVVMTGEVLLTQGPNALAGERLTLDLAEGTGRIEGGVRTIFQTGAE